MVANDAGLIWTIKTMVNNRIKAISAIIPLIIMLMVSCKPQTENISKLQQSTVPIENITKNISQVQDHEYVTITKPFSVDPKNPGYQIPRGSTIFYLKGGIAQVTDSDNNTILWARDIDTPLLPSPGGAKRATHLFEVPNKARIKMDGNITRVYDGNDLVLSVIDEDQPSPTKSPTENSTENSSQAQQPIEVISVKGPVPPINPAGPIIEITLKNVGSEPVDNLTANLGLDRIFVFHFDVTRSNPLLPNHTISTKLNMFQYQFRDDVLYSLTINGTWQNGGTFGYIGKSREPLEQLKLIAG